MAFVLKPHQVKIADALERADGRLLIFGDVGIGKSLAALEYVRRIGSPRTLVICEKTALVDRQWQDAVSNFIPGAPVEVINYEKLLNDTYFVALRNDPPEVIIADEAERIKSPTAKTAKRLWRIGAKKRIALSATPFPNSLWEAFAYVHWLNPGLLGESFYSFKQRYCLTHPVFTGKIIGLRDEAAFRKIIAPYYFRMTEDDAGLNIPKVRSRIEYIDLSPGERTEYDRMKKEITATIHGINQTIPNMVSLITRLLQLINTPWVFGRTSGSAKMTALGVLLLDPVPTICFSEFSTQCKKLVETFGGGIVVGSVAADDRGDALRRFRAGEDKVLWMSSAGTRGLNLQEAKRVIHVMLPYTSARMKQRLGRSRRYGQTDEVEEVLLIARDTVEEKIKKIIDRKERLHESFTVRDYFDILDE